MPIAKEHFNKMAVVWLEAKEGSVEVLEGKLLVGQQIVTVSYINKQGELESATCPPWPFAHESEYYELNAFKTFDELEMPEEGEKRWRF